MPELLKIGNTVNKSGGWDSYGVIHKPEPCKKCPMAAIGKGFVHDYIPENPKIAFILDMPTKSDCIENEPLSGAEGYFISTNFIGDCGLQKSDVLVSHVIRCCQPNDAYGRPKYPSGWVQKPAELNCRYYDGNERSSTGEGFVEGGLLKFNPNVFVVTLHPRTIYKVGAHYRQILKDVSKAKRFIDKGYRPVVLFGEGPTDLYFPWKIKNGGMKTWRGHWWVGESPFKDQDRNEKNITRKQFVEGMHL